MDRKYFRKCKKTTTNSLGIVNLTIGSGVPYIGNISEIDWGNHSHYLRVEIDPQANNNFTELGVTQLVSVPYALFANICGNVVTYNAGNGIDITNGVITNTAPDQIVTLNAGPGVAISGSYPNFTITSTATEYSAGNGINISNGVITNTAPDQTVTINAGPGVSISGSYPNFTVTNTSPDQTITLNAGSGINISGEYPNYTITNTGAGTEYTAGNGIEINNAVITNTAPDQVVTISAGPGVSITGTYPNFTVTNTSPDQTITLNAGNGINISGEYPNYTITNTGAGTEYRAGNGIEINNGTITNTAPDQTVTINAGTGINISGTYPNFTVTNTAPDQYITLNSGYGINIQGSYPTYIIDHGMHSGDVSGTLSLIVTGIQNRPVSALTPSNNQVLKWNGINWTPSDDDNTTYSAGTGLTLTGTTFSHNAHTGDVSGTTALTVTGIQNKAISSTAPLSGQVLRYDGSQWAPANPSSVITAGTGLSYSGNTLNSVWTISGNNIYNNNTGNVGVGETNPTAKLTVKDASNELLFQVKDKLGRPVFEIYQDSIVAYISQTANKTNKGAFVINPKMDSGKPTGGGKNYLRITPDSTRVLTEDSLAGFGVKGLGNSGAQNYMKLTPSNYFIGHESGKKITTGRYNSTLGYQTAMNNTDGQYNIFIGYQSGYNNIHGDKNTFIGYQSGYNNNNGGCIGSCSSNNTFIGSRAGYSNNDGESNTFIGSQSGYSTIDASYGVYIGYNAGYSNESSSGNIYIGYISGMNNVTGANNTCIGYASSAYGDNNNTNCIYGSMAASQGSNNSNNCFFGYTSGYYATSSLRNTAVGNGSGYGTYNNAYNNNCFFGYQSAYKCATGSNNVIIGYQSGYNIGNGSGNVFIGYQAGYNLTGSNLLIIENSNNTTNPLVSGDFATDKIAFHRTADSYPLQVGTNTSNGNGAYLSTGGTWTNASSKTLKDRFEELNSKEILSKISNLDIKAWYYKGTQERHIGPIAEDFYNLFGTGVLDEPKYLGKSLAASDVAGVSLLAVKELIKIINNQNEIINKQNELINKQNEKISSLENEMNKIKNSLKKDITK